MRVRAVRRLGSAAERLGYPAVMVAAYAVFALLQSAGAPLVLATYVPIVLAAGLVMALERTLPYRPDWRPQRGDVWTDLAFMSVVQVSLPLLASLALTLALVGPAGALQLPAQAWWPHHWPVWAQVVAMVAVVDLLRYWLHRLTHENTALWRLHAVHHSVQRLYWLNTGRFHPVEKALQMALDSLPFVLMGVAPTVLALYFLSYAVNGFFQHANIRLRYGPLNYLVGSAETHRWHHSLVPRESNANYGSTLIVWDLVFGTFFLPKGRHIDRLGLPDPGYPRTFVRLLAAPFLPGPRVPPRVP